VRCHRPDGEEPGAAKLDLTAGAAWENLVSFADKDLRKLAFEKDKSFAGDCPAANSKLLAMLTAAQGHHGVKLSDEDFRRFATWMDTYAHIQGSFSKSQEEQLIALRRKLAPILSELKQ
jgi:hypothetical protein